MKKSLKSKSLALLLALTLVAATAFTGCSNKDKTNDGNTTDTVTPGGTGNTTDSEALVLDVCIGPEPTTLDPTLNQTVDGASYANHFFEGLMKIDSSLKVVNGMAESYTVSDDGLVYTFKLRSDAKWSDGTAVTADQFVYSWQRLVDPATAAAYNYIINMVVNANEIMAGEKDKSELGIKAIDASTLEITLSTKTSYFLEICAFPTCVPLREDIISANPDTWTQDPSTFIGNGSYMVTSWEHQSMIVAEQNPNYYDLASLVPDTINFHLIEESNTILASYENGEILFGDDLPTEELARMADKGLYIGTLVGTYFLDLNMNEPAFQDVRVRKALALAIDRNYLVKNITKAGEQPADSYVSTGLTDADGKTQFHDNATPWWNNDDYEANVAEAKKLMAEAGYPNGEGFPTLEYITNTSTTHQANAEAIINMWKENLGINVTIAAQDWAVFVDTRNSGDFQIARDGWLADYNDPLSFIDMYLTGGGNNKPQYSSPEYDALVKQVQASSDNTERMALMHQAEDLLAKDMPLIPIYFYTDPYLKSDKLQGFYSTVTGYKYFMYCSIAE